VIVDDGRVRCWGYGGNGRLGYGNTRNVGDKQTPGSVGPVDLGFRRTATAISAGGDHTCARLDDGRVRCWGYGGNGRLGYCNESNIGDTPATTPGQVGAVNLEPGDGGVGCIARRLGGAPSARIVRALRLQALRARGLRACLRRAASRSRPAQSRGRQACLRRYGTTPGRIKTVQARAISSTTILLTFTAPGSDANSLLAARAYLVKQSRHPIRGARARQQAQTLCHGSCRFNVSAVGTKIELTIKHLAHHTTYYLTVAARDNVSGRLGEHSPPVKVTTR